MGKEKFGVAVDEEIVQEVDELVAESADLGASRSEIVEVILTAFVQSELNHAERVREIDVRREDPSDEGHAHNRLLCAAGG
jgi:metal-responsive CopG/Arc/MetJ family transcriptional regulator